MASSIDILDPFDDGSGVALYQFNGDSTDVGGNYNGNDVGSVAFNGIGVFDACMIVNAVNSSNVTLPNVPWTTITLHIRVTELRNDGGIISTTNHRLLGMDNENLYVGGQDGNIGTIIKTGMATGTWYFMCIINNGDNTYKVVVDDSVVSSNISETIEGAFYGIGCANDGSSYCLKSRIDQVRVFNRILTEEEIQEIRLEDVKTAPEPILDFNATDDLTDKITCTWTDHGDADQFDIWRDDAEYALDVSTPYDDTNITVDTQYTYYVKATNTVGYVNSNTDTGEMADVPKIGIIKLGLETIDSFMVGSDAVDRIMLGIHRVWNASTTFSCDPFGDGSGMLFDKMDGSLVNECGNDIVGSWISTEEYCTGRHGDDQGACNFLANSSQIDYDISTFDKTNGYTVSMWFMVPSSATNNANSTLFSFDTNNYRWRFNGVDGMSITTQGIGDSTAYTIEFDTWYMITTIYDGTTYINYVNGTYLDEKTDSDRLTALHVGNYNNGGGQPFENVVDEMRLFNRPLTEEEIMSLYVKDNKIRLIARHSDYTSETGTISASSEFSSTYAIWKAVDYDEGDVQGWDTAADGIPGWLQYEFTEPKIVYNIHVVSSTEPQNFPKTWTTEVSDNGTDWTVVDTQTDVPEPSDYGEHYVYNIEIPVQGKYIRLNISQSYGAYISIGEWILYGSTTNKKDK